MNNKKILFLFIFGFGSANNSASAFMSKNQFLDLFEDKNSLTSGNGTTNNQDGDHSNGKSPNCDFGSVGNCYSPLKYTYSGNRLTKTLCFTAADCQNLTKDELTAAQASLNAAYSTLPAGSTRPANSCPHGTVTCSDGTKSAPVDITALDCKPTRADTNKAFASCKPPECSEKNMITCADGATTVTLPRVYPGCAAQTTEQIAAGYAKCKPPQCTPATITCADSTKILVPMDYPGCLTPSKDKIKTAYNKCVPAQSPPPGATATAITDVEHITESLTMGAAPMALIEGIKYYANKNERAEKKAAKDKAIEDAKPENKLKAQIEKDELKEKAKEARKKAREKAAEDQAAEDTQKKSDVNTNDQVSENQLMENTDNTDNVNIDSQTVGNNGLNNPGNKIDYTQNLDPQTNNDDEDNNDEDFGDDVVEGVE